MNDIFHLIGHLPVEHDSRPQRALEIGKAAEHLVCADLILNGYRAYLSDQGLPYDLVIDLDSKLLRVQVKATYAPSPVPEINHTPKYKWHVKRIGKNGSRKIVGDEFDILALVALDVRKIAYIPIDSNVPSCSMIRPIGVKKGFTAKHTRYDAIDEHPIQRALESMKL